MTPAELTSLDQQFAPSRDWGLAHPWLQPRFAALSAALHGRGIDLWVSEIYRSESRQQWLFAQGRSPDECRTKGVNPDWARGGAIVTNAWSAATSAHGYQRNGAPAACAIDVVPVGADGRPWTADDDWEAFVRLTTDADSLGAALGLVHFHRTGVAVWDKPHLQMVEWDDSIHSLRPEAHF